MTNSERRHRARDSRPVSRSGSERRFSRVVDRASRLVPLAVMLAATVAAASGCAWTQWNRRGETAAFGPKTPCRLPPHPTAEEVVDYLNQNVDRIRGWEARNVGIRANNIPLHARIVVEREKHLRIQVMSIAGSEMDLGCNEDVFWFWAKRAPEPAVMYARHDQVDLVRESLEIPFEPGWLMEALGVASVPLEGTILDEAAEGTGTSLLVSHHELPSGRKIRKVIAVDNCHGRIMEHSVWDDRGRRIAHATFSKHRLDPETGAILAHHIRLEWPQAELSLSMDLGHVEINPDELPEHLWEMPSMPQYPLVNLEDLALRGRRRRPAPAGARASAASGDELWQVHHEADDRDTEETYDLPEEVSSDDDLPAEDASFTEPLPESEPVESEPLESEPLESEPLESEPVESEPVESEPRDSEPFDFEPVEFER